MKDEKSHMKTLMISSCQAVLIKPEVTLQLGGKIQLSLNSSKLMSIKRTKDVAMLSYSG